MGTVDLSHRADTVELMDTEETTFEDYRACLENLARVNALTLAYRPTLAFLGRLERAHRFPRGRAVSIVDVGFGYGDMLRRIEDWAAHKTITVELTGIDLNPCAAMAARAASKRRCPIRWMTGDVFDHRPEGGIDIVVSSLFAHHLDDVGVVRFLRWMEANAGIGWFVNDLHRHIVPYTAFRAWSRAAGWHRFVRHDGPVSIARAFRRADWHGYLADADIPADAAEIVWHVPFRLCVSRVRPA